MRSGMLLAAAILALSASAASARPGCNYGYNRLSSQNFSRGINAAAPGRAFMNPCSSFYRFGNNRRRLRHHYPRPVFRY